jgi:uncharacterized tellurite resistance protein B-like protein
MLDAIKAFFAKNAHPAAVNSPEQQGPDPVQVAACALMLELAQADEEFSDEEQDHIQEALMRHFDLPAETARQLMALAEQERREAVDLYQFTSLIAANYDQGQRMVLAEILWRVVYSDSRLERHEDYLMRKLASLLDLKPGYLATARKRARARID